MSHPTFLSTLSQNDRYIVQHSGNQLDGQPDYFAVIDRKSGEACKLQTIVAASRAQAALYCQRFNLLSSLSLSQIEQIKDCFMSDHFVCVVKERVFGQLYSEIIAKEGRLTEDEVILFLKQTLAVLSVMHTKGLRHCNLSPDTICLRADSGEIVLTQIGLFHTETVQDDSNHTLSLSAQALQLTGRTIPRDDREDLYSVALTALMLLTGQPLSILFNAQRRQWDWIAFCSVSQELAQLLNQMLSINELDWFASAEEFLFALSLISADADAASSPETTNSETTNSETTNSETVDSETVERRSQLSFELLSVLHSLQIFDAQDDKSLVESSLLWSEKDGIALSKIDLK